MPNVTEHYENLLAKHYSWLCGGVAAKGEEHRAFFTAHGIAPSINGIAVDLGCGSGFQAIPLAQLGFRVLAIDLSPTLLTELRTHKGALQIETIQDDLLHFAHHLHGPVELCVCMGDTLTHLESHETIVQLFHQVASQLVRNGAFILTFRDLSVALTELDRFLLLRSDPMRIFTCYLEYEPDFVIVHDLVYECVDQQWQLHKSCYRKCRISFAWAQEMLGRAGFDISLATVDKGLVTIIARRH